MQPPSLVVALLPTFGQITSINGIMRQIQFGIKAIF